MLEKCTCSFQHPVLWELDFAKKNLASSRAAAVLNVIKKLLLRSQFLQKEKMRKVTCLTTIIIFARSFCGWKKIRQDLRRKRRSLGGRYNWAHGDVGWSKWMITFLHWWCSPMSSRWENTWAQKEEVVGGGGWHMLLFEWAQTAALLPRPALVLRFVGDAKQHFCISKLPLIEEKLGCN